MKTMKTPYGEARVHLTKYPSNGALAVVLILDGAEYEEEISLSVNMNHGQQYESQFLPPNCFYMKDWSENEALATAAKTSGLFKRKDDLPNCASGYVVAEAWEVLP